MSPRAAGQNSDKSEKTALFGGAAAAVPAGGRRISRLCGGGRARQWGAEPGILPAGIGSGVDTGHSKGRGRPARDPWEDAVQTDGSTTRPPRPAGTTKPTLLYARPGIVVTAERFTVGRTSWSVAELTQVWTTRGPHDRLALRAVGVSAALIGAVGVLLGFTGGLQRLTAAAYLTLGVVGLLPLLLALVGDRWRPPAYELWGRYRGADVLLFSSDNERQFGQVTRALQRAREGARLGGWADPVAQLWRPDR
jgi:hypothetical protein